MMTMTNNIPSIPQATCNICQRLLYTFEEVLLCRVCLGSCHWRCVEPKTISQYGENKNFICENCNDGSTSNSSYPITNGNPRIKSSDSINRNHPDFTNGSTETSVANNIRYFEEKQQHSQIQRTTKLSDLDRYLPSYSNQNEYQHQNGQDKNHSRLTQRIQQQQNEIESDNESETSAMFQANYQYTPLKEYAAMRNNRTTNDNNLNGYQKSPSDHQPTPRYGGGLHYTNHGYDPTVSRLIEPPMNGSTHLITPTIDNLSMQNRQHNFISTTNLNIPEKPSRQPQQSNSPLHSSRIHDNGSPIMKSFSQQRQTDHHSTLNSDSGVVLMSSNSQQSYENHSTEKKLTDFVEQLGKQLENDAQKLNEKLELKLKKLENMIHQQTHVIQRQDEVIERLKSQILKIETERDECRDRLVAHEQGEQDEPKTLRSNENDRFHNHEYITEEKNLMRRRYSNSSTTITDSSKASSKKAPAPRIDHQWSTTSDENKSTTAKLVRNVPANRDRLTSDSSSAPSMTCKLVSSVPLIEPSAPSNRLDNIIYQPDTKDTKNSSSSNYSLAQVRHQDRQQIVEPISMAQQQLVTSVHHDDNSDANQKNVVKQKRSSSSSSSSNSSTQPVKPLTTTKSTLTKTAAANRNPNLHRSLESLQNSHQVDHQLKPDQKTASLEFNTKPVPYDGSASIYTTLVEASHPAIQANSIVKGWLRKQNRDSFLKRIERYYCILTNDALLMHRQPEDRTPVKAINLKGAKVFYYDDAKHGPSLELTWSNQSNDAKHYHLYAPNPQEAEQWVTGIQTTIHNLENKNEWQQYRMNI